MPNLRPNILRQLYECSWKREDLPAEVYSDISFEEYVSIERMRFPRATRRDIASRSPIQRFKQLEDQLPANEPSARFLRSLAFGPKSSVDLLTIAPDPQIERVLIQRVRDVHGWDGLLVLPALKEVVVVLCRSTLAARVRIEDKRYALTHLEVRGSGRECLAPLLNAFDPTRLVLETGDRFFDISLLRRHHNIRELSIGATHIRSVNRLAQWPLTMLRLARIIVDHDLASGLTRSKESLRLLDLSSHQAFAPSVLPDLGSFSVLERVEVSVHEDAFHDEWMDYAVARPKIDFCFLHVDGGVQSSAALVEVHNGIEILKVTSRPGLTSYEVSLDAQDLVDGTSVEGLAAHLMEISKAARRKVKISDEDDGLVAQTSSLETARWLVDQSRPFRTGLTH